MENLGNYREGKYSQNWHIWEYWQIRYVYYINTLKLHTAVLFLKIRILFAHEYIFLAHETSEKGKYEDLHLLVKVY